MVAPPASLFLQPHPPLRFGPIGLEVQPGRPSHQARWWPHFARHVPPISLASCGLNYEHLVHARIAPHIFQQLDVFQGGFRWAPLPWRSASSTLCSQMHTFVAFIDIKKAFDSSWVEATLVRRLWHLLANFLCGTLSQVHIGGSASQPWVFSLRCCLTCSSTVSSPLSAPRFLALRILTPSGTCANSMGRPCRITGPQCCARLGSSLAVYLWCWSHRICGHALRSSPSSSRLFRASWRRPLATGPTVPVPWCCSFSHSFLAPPR